MISADIQILARNAAGVYAMLALLGRSIRQRQHGPAADMDHQPAVCCARVLDRIHGRGRKCAFGGMFVDDGFRGLPRS